MFPPSQPESTSEQIISLVEQVQDVVLQCQALMADVAILVFENTELREQNNKFRKRIIELESQNNNN